MLASLPCGARGELPRPYTAGRSLLGKSDAPRTKKEREHAESNSRPARARRDGSRTAAREARAGLTEPARPPVVDPGLEPPPHAGHDHPRALLHMRQGAGQQVRLLLARGAAPEE